MLCSGPQVHSPVLRADNLWRQPLSGHPRRDGYVAGGETARSVVQREGEVVVMEVAGL